MAPCIKNRQTCKPCSTGGVAISGCCTGILVPTLLTATLGPNAQISGFQSGNVCPTSQPSITLTYTSSGHWGAGWYFQNCVGSGGYAGYDDWSVILAVTGPCAFLFYKFTVIEGPPDYYAALSQPFFAWYPTSPGNVCGGVGSFNMPYATEYMPGTVPLATWGTGTGYATLSG